MRNVLLSISGPTGIGKTAWAVRLASHYQTEILSADSRQFYSEMRIGTAVPSAEELSQARHHFIGHKSIRDAYSVGDYQRDALELLQSLYNAFDLVIMAGGSGLYLDAVTRGLDEFPPVKPGIREALNRKVREEGMEALQEQLRELDPAYYQTVDLGNPHRLIRALEVCLSSGQAFSSFLGNRQAPDFFFHLPIGFTAPREVIYRRIEERVDEMMAAGLEEEARRLHPMHGLNALQTVGYQELFAYLEGRWDLPKAVSEIKKNTRRFAKRQETWFRKNTEIRWFPFDTSLEVITKYVDEKRSELKK